MVEPDKEAKASKRKGQPARKKPGYKKDVNLFQAEADYASSIFQEALGNMDASIRDLESSLRWKPDYAPAVVTMGSIEYIRRRPARGRERFMSLLSLPDATPDLCEIIDKAGDFLIQLEAYKDGLELYRAAVARFPDVSVFHQGLGCCAAHRRLHEEALQASLRACELEPGNQRYVNDLGWTLFEMGRLDEAKETLERAVSMDPSDELARENLRRCEQKIAERPEKPPKKPRRAKL